MTKKLTLLICLTVLKNMNSQKKESDWLRQLSASSYIFGTSMSINTKSEIYAIGNFTGTINWDSDGLDSTFSSKVANIFISKIDGHGNLIWIKVLGGDSIVNIQSIAVDQYDNSYTIGYFSGTVDFDPSSGISNLTSRGKSDIFILKLDCNGNIKWVRQFGGSFDEQGYKIELDATRNIYITGWFEGTMNISNTTLKVSPKNHNEILMTKLDSLGSMIWSKSLGIPTGDNRHSFILDKTGNIYFTGMFHGKVDFNPGKEKYYLKSKHYIAKYISKFDLNGNFKWAKSVEINTHNVAPVIAVDKEGNLFTSGHFEGTADFNTNDGHFRVKSSKNRDMFILKVDSLGHFVWVKIIEGNFSTNESSMDIDTFGCIYSTGCFFGKINYEVNKKSMELNSFGNNDAFILKLDKFGQLISIDKIGGNGFDYGVDIKTLGGDNIYTMGIFEGNLVETKSDLYKYVYFGSNSIYIAKLKIQ